MQFFIALSVRYKLYSVGLLHTVLLGGELRSTASGRTARAAAARATGTSTVARTFALCQPRAEANRDRP